MWSPKTRAGRPAFPARRELVSTTVARKELTYTSELEYFVTHEERSDRPRSFQPHRCIHREAAASPCRGRGARSSMQQDSLFDDDWQSKINTFVREYLLENDRSLNRLSRVERGKLVQALQSAGGFRARGAAGYIALVLGVSRATIYNNLGEQQPATDEAVSGDHDRRQG